MSHPLLSEEPCSWVGEMLTCFLGATGAIEALLAVSICAALFLYSADASSVRVRLRWRRRASRLCNSHCGEYRLTRQVDY